VRRKKFSGNKSEIKTIEICFAKKKSGEERRKEVESNKFIIGRLVGGLGRRRGRTGVFYEGKLFGT
jgi:hypothetical protein